MKRGRKAPRVLIVLENNPYPFDQRVRAEAETLRHLGCEVTVLAPGERGEPARETLAGVAVHRYPMPPQGRGVLGYLVEYGYSTALIAARALGLLLRQDFDVVQICNPPDTLFLVGVMARLLGKKVVFDQREPSPELYQSKFGRRGLLYRALVALEGAACRSADIVLTVNESCRRLLINRHGVTPKRVVVVRNDPRVEEFATATPDPATRSRAPFVIGFAGHISSQDGIDYLLRSLQVLKDELGRSDFFAVLAGPADNLASLQRQARELGVAGHVEFTGKLPFGPRLLGYLAAADICVEPAPSNPLNDNATFVKVMEYMALGKPVVAYDLPETRLSAGEAAVYAPPNDPGEFARLIARLMDSPERRAEMGRVGRARVAAQFNWQRSAERLAAAYSRLTGYDLPQTENETHGAAPTGDGSHLHAATPLERD